MATNYSKYPLPKLTSNPYKLSSIDRITDKLLQCAHDLFSSSFISELLQFYTGSAPCPLTDTVRCLQCKPNKTEHHRFRIFVVQYVNYINGSRFSTRTQKYKPINMQLYQHYLQMNDQHLQWIRCLYLVNCCISSSSNNITTCSYSYCLSTIPLAQPSHPLLADRKDKLAVASDLKFWTWNKLTYPFPELLFNSKLQPRSQNYV